MINNPTAATTARPATVDGTPNPATPDCAPQSGYLADIVAPDNVVSFIRTGISGREYVVNVTAGDHSLFPGIVIRGVRQENGRTIFENYGEGSDFGDAIALVVILSSTEF